MTEARMGQGSASGSSHQGLDGDGLANIFRYFVMYLQFRVQSTVSLALLYFGSISDFLIEYILFSSLFSNTFSVCSSP